MKTLYQTIILLAAVALLPACKEKATESSETTGTASSLETYYVNEVPGSAKQISEVFADPTPGKEVVLSGEVMGRMHPFVEGRGMVMLGDPTKITPCNRIPGDECPTPWDNCCDDPEVLKKSIVSIQFLDEAGKVIRTGLRGYKGIKELSFLTVKGTIADGSNAENLLVTAQAFHITEPSPYLNAPPAADYSHHGHLEGGSITEKDGEFIFKKEDTKKEEPAKPE
jgi:hypothetical protein